MRPWLLLALLLGGCGTVDYVDLTLQSVRVVDYWDEPEARNLLGLEPDFPPEPSFKVTFRTAANLFMLPPDPGPITAFVYFCGQPDPDSGLSNGGVFSEGYPAPPLLGTDPERDRVIARIAAAHPTTYNVFIRVRRLRPEPSPYQGAPPHEAYDLAAHPEDLCFHVLRYYGSGFLPAYRSYRSNTVRIPAEALAEAVRLAAASPP